MKISYGGQKFIRSLYSPEQITKVKTMDEIPQKIIKDIRLVSVPGNEPGIPFGSYVNRVADYFGDIDVIQMVTGFNSAKEVGIKSAKSIQQMVATIKSKPKHYFSEFKAGIDRAYYFDIGTLSNGTYKPCKDLLIKSERLYGLKLLSAKEIDAIRKVCDKKEPDGNDYDLVFNLFREHYILRWTEAEVLKGKKKISSGYYLLSDALLDKTAVKIDMIVINDGGKFIEVTNFMALGFNRNGYFEPINIDLSSITPADLPIEIEKLYYSNFHYKPFKIVKRAFAFLKYLHNNWNKVTFKEFQKKMESKYVNAGLIDVYLENYAQILGSTINILYTVNSELDAMSIVLSLFNKDVKREWIDTRLDNLKEPIANVLEIKEEFLTEIMKMIDEVVKLPMDKKRDGVKHLMEVFKKIINFWTIAYFDQIGINPPPKIVLPAKMSYNPNIVRKPWDNPLSPVKLSGGSWFSNIASTIFQKMANAYRKNFCDGKSRPLHKGEFHFGCHNFTGPGTRVDLPEVKNHKPYNNIDACSRTHDLDYVAAAELPDPDRIKAINDADKKAIKCYRKYPTENGALAADLGINGKLSLAKTLPIVSKSIFGKFSASGKKNDTAIPSALKGGCGDCGGGVVPKKNETEKDFIARCIPILIKEGYKKDQAAAICYYYFNKSKGGRVVKSVSEVTDPRMLDPTKPRTDRYRPGEDPERAKQALIDAAKIVLNQGKKGWKEGFEHAFTLPKLDPGWEYGPKGYPVKIKGSGGSDGKIVWEL